MRYKCDVCGIVRTMLYEFKYDDFTFGYKLKFCHDCGEKVREFIRGSEQTPIKENEK